MKFRVLGCSGGIGGDLSTTSFLLNDHILIDCGTGITNLTLPEMQKIRAVYFTHSHLDHVAGLPLLVDTLFENLLKRPLQVYGSKATLEALQTHIFNNVIWPDFSMIPSMNNSVISFNVIEAGKQYEFEGCKLEAIPVNHVVPTVGYRIECGGASLAFTGDTTTNDSFWARLNEYSSLDYLIVECAFSNKEIDICRLAYHYCPSLLQADLEKLQHQPEVFISHLKPGSEDMIMSECKELIPDRDLKRVSPDLVLAL
ncbi:MAG: 3',5'-cyclic-nucleotide phosphodiesterase [Gammaproteobacteria bacterium]|nr:3',5'-cyclic-nucleotide phosphodiesterase [Gammaproteobacteria bacterium]